MVVRLTTARAGRKEKRSKCRKKKRVRREGRRAERCPDSGGCTAGEPGRGPGVSTGDLVVPAPRLRSATASSPTRNALGVSF